MDVSKLLGVSLVMSNKHIRHIGTLWFISTHGKSFITSHFRYPFILIRFTEKSHRADNTNVEYVTLLGIDGKLHEIMFTTLLDNFKLIS